MVHQTLMTMCTRCKWRKEVIEYIPGAGGGDATDKGGGGNALDILRVTCGRLFA